MAVVDVTLGQLRVLALLEDAGPMNLSAVAQGLAVDPSSASRTCDRLVRRGLVDRREDPGDRRNVVLTVTVAGRRILAARLGRR
jgi:DNA-binding MarR family transcriptional regulator